MFPTEWFDLPKRPVVSRPTQLETCFKWISRPYVSEKKNLLYEIVQKTLCSRVEQTDSQSIPFGLTESQFRAE